MEWVDSGFCGSDEKGARVAEKEGFRLLPVVALYA
jgi:hypothetical protein